MSHCLFNWWEANLFKATVEQHFCGVVSLKAPLYLIAVRSPVDIVAVIEKCGSMSGSKITLVKNLRFIIE